MIDNTISFMGSDDAMKELMKSSINSYNTVIEHYDFVINDISSDIYNSKLEAAKQPVIAFLKELRDEWAACRDDVLKKLDIMSK